MQLGEPQAGFANRTEMHAGGVACCPLVSRVQHAGLERTKFQCKTRSTSLPFLATKLNVASIMLLVCTGL